MSSRNTRLSPDLRKRAPSIFQILSESKTLIPQLSPAALAQTVIHKIDAVPGLRTEYFEIVDGRSLQPVSDWQSSPYIVGCVAVHAGEVRLIDNIVYLEP
jgi:pantoate--beta-alanine ligase